MFVTRLRESLKEMGLASGERLEIDGFVVGSAIEPAAMKDANPLEGQRTDSGMMCFSTFDLEFIKGASPGGSAEGVMSELMEGLSEKGGASPSPMDPGGIAATLGDGGDAGVLLKVFREGETGAIGAEGGQKTWGHDLSGAWEVGKEKGIGMGVEEGLNGLVIALDGLVEGSELADEHPDAPLRGLDDRLVGGEGNGLRDGLESGFHEIGAADGVAVIELA